MFDPAKHFTISGAIAVYAMHADPLEEVVVKELAARGLYGWLGGELHGRACCPSASRLQPWAQAVCLLYRRVHLGKRY